MSTFFKGDLMIGIRLGCILAFCVIFLAGPVVYAADVAKIGVIDFQRLFAISTAGKNAQAEINKKGKIMEEELKKRGAKIEEDRKRLEREALVMSKEMREEREREIRININDIKNLQQRYMREFKEVENRLVNRVKKEVFDLIQEIGKSEGYLIIFERGGNVIYMPKAVDITDKLIQKYNSSFSAPDKKSKKKK